MSRLSLTLPCPACGEPMKVSRAQTAQRKVCCPHCRQQVTLEMPPTVSPLPVEADLTPSAAARQLQETLMLCKEKRQLLTQTGREINELELHARSLAGWIQAQHAAVEGTHATLTATALQSRLYEQLLPLAKGRIAIQDCHLPGETSLAHYVQLTFEATGWEVDAGTGARVCHCGEEITFIVAPGPIGYSVASVYMALQSSGIRLHSRIDLEQPADRALLCVHQVSKVPRLLPAPKVPPQEIAATDFKRSA